MTPRWQNVTPPDPARTTETVAGIAHKPLKDALRLAICDPGAFTPRRVRGPKGDRQYESVEAWGARACAVLVRARLGLEG